MYCIEDLTELQISIMMIIKSHASEDPQHPIPKSHIIKRMTEEKIKDYRILHAIDQLLKKGYIRPGYSEHTNKTVYVMMRSI